LTQIVVLQIFLRKGTAIYMNGVKSHHFRGAAMKSENCERQSSRIIFNLISALEVATKQPNAARLAKVQLQNMSISSELATKIGELLDFVVEHNLY
jgi:hypothetical protein